MQRLVVRAFAAALMASLMQAGAFAQSAGTRIDGTVVDQSGGLAVTGATVALYFNETKVATAQTDANGKYLFVNEPPGAYFVVISAVGFAPGRSDTIYLAGGENETALATTLARAQVSTGNLREIGRVNNTASLRSLQTTTVVHSDFDAQRLQKENYVRVGDALQTLPGVNLTGTSSSLGDDLGVNVRGIGDSETTSLLDGHPIGPVGAGSGSFNYQDTPAFALRNTQVVYGSGALGLYGTDAIGGVVDMQTLEPTRANEFMLKQGVGNYGKGTTVFQATGSAGAGGRLGYAVVHAVQGTYGDFGGQPVAQTGLAGTDVNPADIQTYPVSSAYLLRSDLLKLRYSLSPVTDLTFTGYDGDSWDDKSGNGDNDFLTPDEVYYQGQQTVKGGGSFITASDGKTPLFSCSPGTAGSLNGNPLQPGIAVQTGSAPASASSYACYTPSQYATAASGPAGGGVGPFQAIRNQDYHMRFTTALGHNSLVADGFADNYAVDYNRNVVGGPCSADSTCSGLFPGASFLIGGFDTNFTRTSGVLLSDDIVANRNDFGFGYFGLHQTLSGDTYNTSTFAIDQNPGYNFQESNYFIRDAYTATGSFSVFLNTWLKHTTVTDETKLDPRLSLVFRPSGRDVVRLTAGSSTEAPAPSLLYGVPNLNQTPTNINVNCNGLTSVGSSSNPTLGSETGAGEEFAYGHSFQHDTNVQVDVYNENVFGKIFSAHYPVSTLGPNFVPANLLNQYEARLRSSACPLYSSLSQAQLLQLLSIDAPLNAAQGRFRGIEITGRYRFNPFFYVDYTADTQSAALIGVPNAVLQASPTIVPGSQVAQIPLHKYSAGFDVSDRKGLEVRLDTYFIGDNNSYNRPAYIYSNAFISKDVGHGTNLNLGVFNVFNSIVDTYGRIGLGEFQAENIFGTDQNAFDQGSERFGLPPTQLTFTVTQKI